MSIRDTKEALDENDPAFRDARGIEIAITAGRARVVVTARDGELSVNADRLEEVDDRAKSIPADDAELGKERVTVISQINEA